MKRQYTMSLPGLVFLILCIALGLFDLGCVVFTGVSSTLSTFLVSHGATSPVMVFTFGVLAGHLFFYMTPVKSEV